MVSVKGIFRPCLYAVLLLPLVMFQTPWSMAAQPSITPGERSEIPPQWDETRGIARLFLKRLADNPTGKIDYIRLSYDVHMDLEAYVQAEMLTTLEMKKQKKDYLSIFSLKEPVGKNLWSKFALFVYGKHTAEYKEMMKTVETSIQERFRPENGRFVTEEFREILPGVKLYENQTGIRVYFDYKEKLVKFWEDQTRQTFSRFMPYSNQLGPLTAFFNFLLFLPTRVEITVINAIKQVEDISPSGELLADNKIVHFLFGSQVVRLHENNTGDHTEYSSAIFFEGKNYLDIIYGKNIFFELAHSTTGKAKVPYAIYLDGIISKSKKRKLERKLRRLVETPQRAQELEKEREAETLAAKNVKIYLTGADVTFASKPGN